MAVVPTNLWFAPLLLALVATPGCLRTLTDTPWELSATGDSIAGEGALEEVERLLTVRVTRRDTLTNTSSAEVTDGWYRPVEQQDRWIAPRGEYRWRHDGVAALLKARDDDVAALRLALKSDHRMVRDAALIALARLEPQRHAAELCRLAKSTDRSLGVRRSAIETLASARSLETEAFLRSLLTHFDARTQGADPTPVLFAEAQVGLARHVAVDSEPLFSEALTAEDIDVQSAALAALAASRTRALPAAVESLAKSPHPHVRRAALAALVAADHPAATAYLSDAVQDADLFVRLGAIELLGQAKSHEAVLLLHQLARDDHERHREAAAVALVAQGEWAAVERSARDSSYRVRMAVASALATHSAPERVALARVLAQDSSAMVQAKLCESLASWPPELAIPVLLECLGSANLLTRQAAQQSFTTLKMELKGFNPGGSVAERAAFISALRTEWLASHPSVLSTLAVRDTNSATIDEVARLIRQFQNSGDPSAQWIARKQLERLGGEALPVLDSLIAQKRLALTESTQRELLPVLSPACAALESLRDPDVAVRRTAARKLAQEAALTPLPQFALARLEAIARTESDTLVWADVLRAASQTGALAPELALAALAHGEADVRRRGCEYLATHGDAQHAEPLLALLTDRDPVVARGAIAALGRCGPTRSRDALYALLAHSDVHFQIAAAMTLARWKDARGSGALERLALAPTSGTRRLAVAAMGELADAEYLDPLIRALDDQPSVQLAALAALPSVAGEDILAKADLARISTADKARAWREWHAAR